MGDLSKLPKWVQDYIRGLEGGLRELREENALLVGLLPPSDTYIENYVGKEKNRFIYFPNTTTVTFVCKETGLKVRVNSDYQGDGIRVDLGMGGVVIPHARNVIHIVKGER